jgi:hypothetical protein
MSENFTVTAAVSLLKTLKIRIHGIMGTGRSQRPRDLRRGFAAGLLVGLRVRLPPGVWMSVFCGCFMLSLHRADHSSRGVLLTVVCLNMIVKLL